MTPWELRKIVEDLNSLELRDLVALAKEELVRREPRYLDPPAPYREG